MAVHTLGDGKCLFHSIWKQLFPQQQDNAYTVRFMRQVTLYVVYKNEDRYRQMVTALGYTYSFDQYVADIMQMGTYCGDLALLALSEATNRPVYCYNSFINNVTGTFFFDNSDFHTLKSMFLTRAQGTWQHTIFNPPTFVDNARKPLKIMFDVNHFTAIVNTCVHDDLVPQTSTFNGHAVLVDQ